MKRGIGMQSTPPVQPDSPASSAVSSCCRARSSDPRSFGPPAKAAPSSAVRSRSEQRPSVTAAKASQPAHNSDEEDSDDADDDGLLAPRAGGAANWKADVKKLVQEFAENERSRGAKPRVSDANCGDSRKKVAAQAAGASVQVAAPSVVSSSPRRHQPSESEDPLQDRKPRYVNFTPATIDDYKTKFGDKEKINLGSLGPDLDD